MSADFNSVSDLGFYLSALTERGRLEKSVSASEFGIGCASGIACASEYAMSESSVPGTEGYGVENIAGGVAG